MRSTGKLLIKNTALYSFLIIASILFISPLLWMVSTAFKTPEQTYNFPPTWIPNPITFQNFVSAFIKYPLGIFLRNSTIVALASVVGTVISCAMVAFAFGRLNWFGRDFLFIILLATMTIPSQVTMIPVFILFYKLGWINTFKPLIVPQFFAGGVSGGFYIFMLRQFIMSIPREIDEAAKIDGCGYFQIFYLMLLPLLKPALGAITIFSFMDTWNEFMAPLIYLNDQNLFTLPLGLQYFRLQDQILWNELMSGSLVALLPCIIIFFLGQKYFIKGVNLRGGKG